MNEQVPSKEQVLQQRVRDSGTLVERLQECRRRIAKMCSERRGPRMSVPVEWGDDDFYICLTLEDAIAEYSAHEPPAEQPSDLAKATRFDHDTWPHGMLWRIGGINFVEFDVAMAAIQKALATPPPVEKAGYLAPPPRSEWQPIETAPKYKDVLVWRDDAGAFVAQFRGMDGLIDVDDPSFDAEYEAWFANDSGWQEGNEKPTHWQPLPSGPTKRAEPCEKCGGSGRLMIYDNSLYMGQLCSPIGDEPCLACSSEGEESGR